MRRRVIGTAIVLYVLAVTAWLSHAGIGARP